MSVSPFTASLPIPSDLKSPNPQTPWRITPGVFGRMNQQTSPPPYEKEELSENDPEFSFVHRYFNHQKPTNRSIAKIYCIHNPSEATVFENKLPAFETEAGKPFFNSQWMTEHLSPLRKQAIDRFKAIASLFSPFEVQFSTQRKQKFNLIYVLPLWHGSTAAKCDSICSSGFAFFGKHGYQGGGASSDSTDVGFFGSGIYFTTSARYATDIYSDGQNLLLGWVSMREPFPVISDTSQPGQCTDMKRLKGQGAYHKYNAHYIPVISADPSNPSCPNYYPCYAGAQPAWDEIVVFQQSQTLTRFWVVLQVDLTKPVPGSSLTVGALLKIVSDCLDQQKVQENQQLSNFLESKEDELASVNPTQTLNSSDVTFFNYMNQLLDEKKNIRDRIAKKLLSSSSSAPSSPATQPPMIQPMTPSFPSPIISNDNSAPGYSYSNPIPSVSNLSIYPQLSPTPTQHIQPSVKSAPPIPSMAFGAAKWKEYFGDVGVEPPLPSDIQQILQSPCPFWPGKRVEETHLLVLAPQTVNGKPLTLTSLGELVKSPKQGNATQYRYFHIGEYTDAPASKSHWVLMTRDVLPGSRNKRYTDQQALVESYAQQAQIPYEVPHILDATVAIWMHYVTTGNRLYSDEPYTYTRCQEKWDAKWQLAVGGFSPAGLRVYSDYDSDNGGVGGSRKF